MFLSANVRGFQRYLMFIHLRACVQWYARRGRFHSAGSRSPFEALALSSTIITSIGAFAKASFLAALHPQVPGKLDVLRRHREDVGWDYEEIERTCAFAFDVGENGEKAEKLVGQLRWFSGMDIETVIGMVWNVDRISPSETIGREVVPAVAEF